MFDYLKRGPAFYRGVVTLAVPIILQNLITTSLGLIDTFMVGALGEAPLAAVTLANTRPFIKNNILFAVVFFFAGNMLVSLLEMAGLFFIPLGLRFSEQGAALTFETTLSSLMEAGMGTNGMEAITAVSFGMGSILVDAAVAVGFLFLAKWIMTRKASVK